MNVENALNRFGELVFNDEVMQTRLPKDVYKKLKKTISDGETIDPSIADVVANAMKDWAVDKGATHYTHWFQPLTGATAEKHDSFFNPVDGGKGMLLEFKGKELIKGEPDASSFPNGGIRETFEARGYTAWDCTSPAFLRDNGSSYTLYIPTAFYSYTGEALDKKTPLLRSMQSINEQALRVLKIFGNDKATRVTSTVGPEQEYFLIDRSLFESRMDLITSGRTLFGAPAPKGQELDDHYFGAIKERVAAYMHEVDAELWRHGVNAKTKHNEVAPSQFEIAVVYGTTNVATDHNHLVMEILKSVAGRHDLVCLLHEKPYAKVNGSGKHNNWSLSSNDGQNLLEPGATPHDNLQFLVFLIATVAAVDKYSDLLRASAANSGNDHRLGGNEAPPAIISAFVGTQLTEIIEGMEKGELKAASIKGELQMNVKTLPSVPVDNTDRNRTSPFAFTGNRFEFRMPPSSGSVAGPNCVLNTIVAKFLDDIATEVEKSDNKDKTIQDVLVKLIKAHKKIIFNGDGYGEEWVKEAEKRGLPNVKNTVGALAAYIKPANVELFEKYNVLSKRELHSRYEVYVERYAMDINIEAKTSLQLAKRDIVPAVSQFLVDQAATLSSVESLGLKNKALSALVKDVNANLETTLFKIDALESAADKANAIDDTVKQAEAFRDKVFTAQADLRETVDYLETIVGADYWPLPTYAEMMFML